MRKQIFYVLGLFALMLGSVSCEDCYYIENDLHGIWQVVSVERKSTGKVTEAKGKLYYMFQRSMVQLCKKPLNVPESMIRYIARFDLMEPDSVGMGDFRLYTTGEGNFVNDEEIIPIENLYEFGIFQDYTMFHMQQSKQNLILESDSVCVLLRKY